MYKVPKVKFSFLLGLMTAGLCLSFIPLRARAELRDSQSFQPIEWESDFVRDNSLALTWLGLPQGTHLAKPDDQDVFRNLRNTFGLQLGQLLRDHWQGRIGLFLTRTNPKVGGYVWGFLGSDLQHALIPEALYDQGVFRYFRPYGHFGLGFSTRWENSKTRYNLIPTFRYEASEPAAYGGFSAMYRLSDELLLGFEFRYFQSARNSQNHFPSWGGSLVWGGLEKR